jgi:quercetin dioxygenase-like cupin family protein
MNSYTLVQNLSDMVGAITPDSILSRTVYKDEHTKVVLFGFAEGQSLSAHNASQRAILQIVHGNAEIVLGEDSHTISDGT